jgi:hypothetical protein
VENLIGLQNLAKVLKHAAQSPCSLVFLKRSGHPKNGTKQLANNSFVEKEKAR